VANVMHCNVRPTPHLSFFISTTLHAMQTRCSDENSVCPSVCPSVCLSVKRVLCDKTVERSVQIYIPYERTFCLVFWEEEWLVGGKVCYKVSLCENCQRQSCKAFIGLTNRAKMIGGGRPLVPEILDQSDRVGAKSSIFAVFSLIAP